MWRYTLADWHPDTGLTLDEWAQKWADDGWQLVAGPGAAVTVNGRRVWRVSLRRWEGPAEARAPVSSRSPVR